MLEIFYKHCWHCKRRTEHTIKKQSNFDYESRKKAICNVCKKSAPEK